MKYTLEMTERQAGVLQVALEIFARLGIGQWRDAIDRLPLKEDRYLSGWHDDLLAIGHIIQQHTKKNVDGWQSSFSIHSSEVDESAKIAWDMHQVIRNRLAWDQAISDGIVDGEGSVRDWQQMSGRQYDEPMSSSNEPMAAMKKIEG